MRNSSILKAYCEINQPKITIIILINKKKPKSHPIVNQT